VEASKRKLAENEARFRDANEKLQAFAVKNASAADRAIPFLCECDRRDCTEVLLATLPEYERVRSDGRQSVMVKGHDNPETERVVGEGERFVVTWKFGVAAQVYEELDPRS
jgi:hypothetical protein